MGLKCYFALLLLAAVAVAQPIPEQIEPGQGSGEIIDEALLEAKEASILK